MTQNDKNRNEYGKGFLADIFGKENQAKGKETCSFFFGSIKSEIVPSSNEFIILKDLLYLDCF